MNNKILIQFLNISDEPNRISRESIHSRECLTAHKKNSEEYLSKFRNIRILNG